MLKFEPTIDGFQAVIDAYSPIIAETNRLLWRNRAGVCDNQRIRDELRARKITQDEVPRYVHTEAVDSAVSGLYARCLAAFVMVGMQFDGDRYAEDRLLRLIHATVSAYFLRETTLLAPRRVWEELITWPESQFWSDETLRKWLHDVPWYTEAVEASRRAAQEPTLG